MQSHIPIYTYAHTCDKSLLLALVSCPSILCIFIAIYFNMVEATQSMETQNISGDADFDGMSDISEDVNFDVMSDTSESDLSNISDHSEESMDDPISQEH